MLCAAEEYLSMSIDKAAMYTVLAGECAEGAKMVMVAIVGTSTAPTGASTQVSALQ